MENLVFGLEVSFVSLIVVFLTLYLLSLLIDLVRVFVKDKPKEKASTTTLQKAAPRADLDDDGELNAVVAAAIQAYESNR